MYNFLGITQARSLFRAWLFDHTQNTIFTKNCEWSIFPLWVTYDQRIEISLKSLLMVAMALAIGRGYDHGPVVHVTVDR